MAQPLSSSATHVHMAVMPLLVVGGVGTGLVAWGLFGTGYELEPRLLAFAVWVVVSAFTLHAAYGLRDVVLDGDTLITTDANGNRERIPLTDVIEIEGAGQGRITVLFRLSASRVGAVTFLPKTSMRLPFTPHPVEKLLREKVAAARSRTALHAPGAQP